MSDVSYPPNPAARAPEIELPVTISKVISKLAGELARVLAPIAPGHLEGIEGVPDDGKGPITVVWQLADASRTLSAYKIEVVDVPSYTAQQRQDWCVVATPLGPNNLSSKYSGYRVADAAHIFRNAVMMELGITESRRPVEESESEPGVREDFAGAIWDVLCLRKPW